jgi:uncharacterized protein YjlB
VTAPEELRLADGGAIPNSRLPVLVYRGVEGIASPAACAGLFAANGWLGAWVDGIYPFHHFHSTSHEVLGVVAGAASVTLGGPDGETLTVRAGDVLVLPAGTGHRNAGAEPGLVVVGAYPDGMAWDLRRGDPAEREEVLANIAAVPLPGTDPVYGPGGPLTGAWRAETRRVWKASRSGRGRPRW